MQLKEVLNPIFFVIDEDSLNILVSSTRKYLDKNFLLFVQADHTESFIESLNKLKNHRYTSIIIPLNISTRYENFQLNIFKVGSKYYITAIQTDGINNMIYELNNLESFAYTDQLTGALNRYAYWEILLNLLYDIEREKRSLGVIFVDIDNLKKINTEKGYAGGDYVISTVADIIKTSKRKSDLVVRLGGDEFLILAKFQKEHSLTLESFAMRILRKVRSLKDPYMSVSMGAYTLSSKKIKEILAVEDWKKEWNKIVVYLDGLLREAKKSGKDRIYTRKGALL